MTPAPSAVVSTIARASAKRSCCCLPDRPKACDALAEPEDELRVVGHAVGRPGWVERQLDLDLLDPGNEQASWIDSWIIGPAGHPIDVSEWMT